MNPCPFCNIESSEVIVKYKSCLAFYDNYPVSEGHSLVILKRHVSNYFELSLDEKSQLWLTVDLAKDYLVKKFNPDGFNIGININESAGQTVSHCHIHIIPRYIGDTENPQGGVRGVIPSKQKY